MKILQVVHRYLPYSLGGTEIYTHTLSTEQAKYNDVYVFTRISDIEKPSYYYFDSYESGVNVRRVNKISNYLLLEDKYLDKHIEELFLII